MEESYCAVRELRACTNVHSFFFATAFSGQMDDSYFWYSNISATGETHLQMIQNAEHTLVTNLPEVLEGVCSFARDIFARKARPSLQWTFGTNGKNATISVTTSEKPKRVIVRHAETLSDKRRDWRLVTGETPCPTVNVSGEADMPFLT